MEKERGITINTAHFEGEKKRRIGIVCSGTHTLAGAATIAAMEKKGIEVIHISSEEAHDRGIRMGNVVVGDLKSIAITNDRMLGLPLFRKDISFIFTV